MAKRTEDSGGLSLRTKDASDGGGIEGALATISEINFVDDFDYGGTRSEKQAALNVVYLIPGMERPWEQGYSVGPAEKYEVLAGGDSIKSAGKARGLNKNCNAFRFFEALEAAAEKSNVDVDELLPIENGSMSIRPLEGRTVRLGRMPYETVGGDKKDLVVIDEFVTDEAPAKSGKTAAPKANALEAQVTASIESLLEEHTSIKVGDLAKRVFDANRKDPQAKAMMQMAMKANWVEADDRPWTVTKGVLRMPS